jgi:predicted TIM-barrel fold metal-dependent hydrolase
MGYSAQAFVPLGHTFRSCESPNFDFRLAESRLSRLISQTILDQVWITRNGFFSLPPFMTALLTFGVDRILFSVDYPFSSNEKGREFVDHLPVGAADKRKIAHKNADVLLKL